MGKSYLISSIQMEVISYKLLKKKKNQIIIVIKNNKNMDLQCKKIKTLYEIKNVILLINGQNFIRDSIFYVCMKN